MRFAAFLWLPVGVGVAALLTFVLVFEGYRQRRSVQRFGEPARVRSLFTSEPATRRGAKGVLSVLAVLLAFVAAARPQFGEGERLVPRTNLDVVVVLDFSKSMYAEDVQPSRIFRAKLEVERLVKALRGARFGAVAFAGEAISFPLTPDGAAIAQFLRQLQPMDMPVGGTAIARALVHARDMLARDPLSSKHERVVVLVTDGEDLEGNPVDVARGLAEQKTTVHVVQIGSRTPERLPDIGPDGRARGWRVRADGRPMTTQLSAEGEAQLEQIATVSGGTIVRAERGTTGIDRVTTALREKMVHELGERVESVYADVFHYPLGLAIALLVAEAFVGEARRRQFVRKVPPPPKPRLLGRFGKLRNEEAHGR